MDENKEKNVFSDEIKNIYLELKSRERAVAWEWFKKRVFYMVTTLITISSLLFVYIGSGIRYLICLWILFFIIYTTVMLLEMKAYIETHIRCMMIKAVFVRKDIQPAAFL